MTGQRDSESRDWARERLRPEITPKDMPHMIMLELIISENAHRDIQSYGLLIS